MTDAARKGKKLSDIADEKQDELENRQIAMDVIKNLSVQFSSVAISYDRFRSELVAECGEDILPQKPMRFMNSLLTDLRTCGINLELKKVKGILQNGEKDTVARTGFMIHCLDNGHLMADAMHN